MITRTLHVELGSRRYPITIGSGLLTQAPLLAGLAPEKAIIPTVLSVIIGAAFGFVSEKLANLLTKKA